MDAPTLSSDRLRELAVLRSRAYGPDADIDRDADALARLVELEELARAEVLDPASADQPAATPRLPGASDATASSTAAGQAATAVIDKTDDAAPAVPGAETAPWPRGGACRYGSTSSLRWPSASSSDSR
jgi:hypothetical protein